MRRAVSWSICPRCSRSVSRRSPSGCASTRPASPAARAASWTAAMPRVRNRSSQLRTRSATSSASTSPPESSDCGVSPMNEVSATARTRLVRCCSSASSSTSHSSAAWLSITLLPPATTDGMPWAASAARMASTRLTLESRSAMSPASIGSPSKVAPGAEQPRDVGREVDSDVLAQGVDADGAVAAGGEVLRPELTHAQRRGCRSPDQPAVLVVRLDVEDGDPGVAQLGAAAQLLQRVDQGCVAAPVGGQRPAGRSRAGRLQVGDDVAPAEGIDRLLGVTDQDQRRVAGERPVEHVPLHRVGVLELVDQDHLPALAHPFACRCVVVLERVGEPAEQVVVRQDAAAVLAPLHLGAHRLGEVDLGLRRASRLGVGRRELCLRVTDRCPRQLQGDGALERRRLRVRAVLPEVEVVGHLDHELVEVVHQLRTRVGVAGDARGSAAPAGRTGGWSRSSRRRSRPVRR